MKLGQYNLLISLPLFHLLVIHSSLQVVQNVVFYVNCADQAIALKQVEQLYLLLNGQHLHEQPKRAFLFYFILFILVNMTKISYQTYRTFDICCKVVNF